MDNNEAVHRNIVNIFKEIHVHALYLKDCKARGWSSLVKHLPTMV